MHESGLSEAIVGAALRRGDGRRVTAVRVRVGGHPVDPYVVTMGFHLAACGTAAEGAELELVLDPMSVRCNGCGHEAVVDDHLSMVACARCGSLDIELDGHDEAVLESVTLAETAGYQGPTRTGANEDRGTHGHEGAGRGHHSLDLRGDELRR